MPFKYLQVQIFESKRAQAGKNSWIQAIEALSTLPAWKYPPHVMFVMYESQSKLMFLSEDDYIHRRGQLICNLQGDRRGANTTFLSFVGPEG